MTDPKSAADHAAYDAILDQVLAHRRGCNEPSPCRHAYAIRRSVQALYALDERVAMSILAKEDWQS